VNLLVVDDSEMTKLGLSNTSLELCVSRTPGELPAGS
jgi:hypothetical protein